MTGPTRITTPYSGVIEAWEWTLAAGENGTPIVVPDKADKTVHVFGTFGGNVAIQGSLETASPANFVALTNSRGDSLATISATTLATIQENVYFLRPVAGGGVSAVTVRVLMR